MNYRLKFYFLAALVCCAVTWTAQTCWAGPTVTIESRDSAGAQNPLYTQNGPMVTTSKSTAAGLSGTGSYYAGDTTPVKYGDWAFTPTIGGYYHVNATWANYATPGGCNWVVNNADGAYANTTLQQTGTNGNVWNQVTGTSPLRFMSGTAYATRLNTNATGTSGKRVLFDSIQWVWHQPLAPTGLTATAVSQTQINLSWTGVDLPSGGYYKIERKTGSGGAWGQIATNVTATTFNNTGLACNTQYYYRVIAFETNNSDYSTEANATTLPCTPAAPSPAGVSALTDTSLTWNWVDNSNNESGFRIYSAATGGTLLATVTGTSWQETGLSSDTAYTRWVSAYNAGGESARVQLPTVETLLAGAELIFLEGFNNAITGWTNPQDIYPPGPTPTAFDYSIGQNHGTFTGAGAAHMEYVAYPSGSVDQMYRKYYRVSGLNGEAGPYVGDGYPTPFGEGIVSGYFYDPKNANKSYAGGHSCTRFRQALSLRHQTPAFGSSFVIDNGIYYGSPLVTPYPSEEFGSQRDYAYRLVGADGANWTQWGALRWDQDGWDTYPKPNECGQATGWIRFQTQIVPDTATYDHSQAAETTINLWRDQGHGVSEQTLSRAGTTNFWKYGFEKVTLGLGAYSEDSEGWWDDIVLQAQRPGDPVIAPAQAGPLPGNDPKTSITWYWTNANVGNNIFAYDLADPAGVNKAPVYPMGQPGDGLLDGESDEWIQRWQTQYTEVGLTPNAPYRRKVHAYNGTLNSNYTDVSFQTRLADGITIVGNNTGPFPDVSTYPWAQAEVDPTGAGTSGNLYFWDGYTHPEEHLAIDGVAVAPNTAHGHGPSSAWWHKHISGHIPFAFENSAIFGTSTHGGSVWKASRFKYIWNMSATPPAWNSSTPATEWSSGTINLACTDTFLPGGAPVDGAYYLHVAAMNENGEWNYTAADTATYGPFQYDHTVPNNPAIGCDDGFGEGEVHADPSPSFTLSGAADPGTEGVNASGLEDTPEERYRYYWGPEPLPTGAGAPTTLSDETITGLTLPMNTEGTYYLHVQTKDEAGNWSDPVTWTYNFKTPEWEFPTGAVNLAPPGVYNWDVWTDPLGKHDSMVYASSNSKAHGVWGTADLVPGTPAPKLKDAVQAEDIWLEADPSGALDLNGPVYGRLPVARLMVGATPTATRTVIGGTCAPDTAQSGRVYAIEAGTRQVLWTHDIGAGYNVKAKPGGAFNKTIGTYTGDVIYAVTDKQGANNYLRALKATDGTKLWSTDELGLTGVGPILGAPFLMPVGAQEAVYFATMDDGAQPGGVYAVNLATGSLLNGNWPKQLGSFKSALGTDGSFVYGVNEAGHLWKISLDGSSATDIATLDVGANQGIYGAPCWVYPRWVAGGNWLIISSNAGKVYCIDVANPGTPKWVVDIPAPSCPIYWNGSVYVGSSNKKLYQLDVDDGSVVTSRNLPATVGDPVIDQVWNRLYLHAGDGVMYGFNLPL